MSKTFKRLIYALIISGSCWAGTDYWYYKNKINTSTQYNEPPVAKLDDATNEVQRKQAKRVIWESLSKNQLLYKGESVRTDRDSEARILFINSGTIIDLEPDSLIVLEETQKGLALNFLKGNLFVTQSKTSTSKSEILLKTGENKIRLNNANLSLSKQESGKVNLEVFKGTASLEQQSGKQIQLDAEKSGQITEEGVKVEEIKIEVLGPAPDSVVYIDQQNQIANFNWKPISPDFKVYLEYGRRRSELIASQTYITTGDKGSLPVKVKAGKLFWRLVAVSSKESGQVIRSKTFPLSVVAKVPPTPIFPVNQTAIKLDPQDPSIAFKWANPSKLQRLVVEIAKDSTLKEKILTKPVDENVFTEKLQLKQTGTLFWRLTGYMPVNGKLEPISSEVEEFSISKDELLNPPQLLSPVNNLPLAYMDVMQNGVIFTWKPMGNNITAELLLKPDTAAWEKTYNTPKSTLKLRNLRPGKYSWQVVGIKGTQKSPPSITQVFEVLPPPDIKWLTNQDVIEYKYATQTPSIRLDWQTISGIPTAKYQVRIADTQANMDKQKWIEATSPSHYFGFINQQGQFFAVVRALDEAQKEIATSKAIKVNVKQLELLPAPKFSKVLPDIIRASKSGKAEISWDAIDGAKNYQVELMDESNNIKSFSSTSPNVSLNKLKPGQYKVLVNAIDKFDREGLKSKQKVVEVPSESDIRAPKIKGIKIQ